MPAYDYFCDANQQTVEVQHSMQVKLNTWGELCYAAQIPLGNTDLAEPVRKIIRAPHVATPVGNSRLKEKGFTKLVKRDDGVYENVTRTNSESRYFKPGDPGSQPDLKRKIRD
ncbi:MAG: zinc ribbon domain-containing protein [Gammaproteobacteria bacterium]